MKSIFVLLFASSTVLAQWPGYFYTFVLKDNSGNIIDSSNKNYEMTTIKATDSSDIMLSIKTCDNYIWRFYEGGYHDLDKTHMLKIKNIITGKEMIIQFPSSLSGGKEKYYRDLYAGEIKFVKGTYKIKLPETDNQWDGLKTITICQLSYMNLVFYDISGFQK